MEHKSSNYGLFLTFIYTDGLIEKLNRDSEWKVLFNLLKYMNWKTGFSFPSIQRIQDETGLSYRTVFDAISRLESKGIIEKSKAKFGATQYYNNVYKILGWRQDKLREEKTTLPPETVEQIIEENLL